MSKNKNNPYPTLQFRDNKEKTFTKKANEIISSIMDLNPDELTEEQILRVNISYVMKEAINQMHKKYCNEL